MSEQQMLVNTPALQPAPPPLLKLDLASGQSPREGFEGVDLWDGAKHKVDLLKFPWPWADNSVEELHCSHFIEHIPAREVESRDLAGTVERGTKMEVLSSHKDYLGQDMFLAFFDECYRVLRPGGVMTVLCPCGRSNRAFQDPTHRRFIVSETFLYLNADWRKANKLDHYRVKCNFGFTCDPIVSVDMTLLHPEAQYRRFNEGWNTILDWSVKLTSGKTS